MTGDKSRVVVRVPALGESVTGGVVRFLKKPGESVQRDEPVAELETDKVSIELVAPEAGLIESLVAADQATVRVDDPLYVLRPGASAPLHTRPAPPPRLPALAEATLRWDVGHIRARARGLAGPPAGEAALILTAIARALAAVPGLSPSGRAIATSWVDLERDTPRWVCAPLPVDIDVAGALALTRVGLPGEPPGADPQLRVLRLHGGVARSARLAGSAALQIVIGPVQDEPVVIAGAVVVRPIATISVETRAGRELLPFVAVLAEQLAQV